MANDSLLLQRKLTNKNARPVTPFPQGSLLDRSTTTKRAVGMSYPQFVEVLVLVAASAARRLRNLYPDVVGEPASPPTARGPRNSGSLTDASGNDGTNNNGSSAFESKSAGAERRVDLGGAAKAVRAAMRLRNGRFVQKLRVVCSSLVALLDEVL